MGSRNSSRLGGSSCSEEPQNSQDHRLPQVWGLKLESKPLYSHPEVVTVQPLSKEKLCLAVGLLSQGTVTCQIPQFPSLSPNLFTYYLPARLPPYQVP